MGSERAYFDLTRVSGCVSEGHQHDTRNIDHLTVDLEDASGSLHLGFESMGRSTKPENRGRQLTERAAKISKE